MPITHDNILALDVGSRRVGVAIATAVARLPRPLITLTQDDNFWPVLENIIEIESIGSLVVGLPRGLSGQQTSQTSETQAFLTELRKHVAMPIHLQDEALTSKKAQKELNARGKPYDKGDIDSLAATYILDDFLTSHAETISL